MSQFEQIYDANTLIEAFQRCRKGVNWKASVQRYAANLLVNTYYIQQKLKSKQYEMSEPFEFNKCERGKLRHIKALTVQDRVIQRALLENKSTNMKKAFAYFKNKGEHKWNRKLSSTKTTLIAFVR